MGGRKTKAAKKKYLAPRGYPVLSPSSSSLKSGQARKKKDYGPNQIIGGSFSGKFSAVSCSRNPSLEISFFGPQCIGGLYGIVQFDSPLNYKGDNQMIKINLDEKSMVTGGTAGASFPAGSNSEINIRGGSTISGGINGIEERSSENFGELKKLLSKEVPDQAILDALTVIAKQPADASIEKKKEAVEKYSGLKAWAVGNWQDVILVLAKLAIDIMEN